MKNSTMDAERLLSSLIWSKTTATAWDKHGKTGWGEDGPHSFMASSHSDPKHATDTRAKVARYYTPELEKVVEWKWGEAGMESPVHDL